MSFRHGLPMIEGSLRKGSSSCLSVESGAEMVVVGTAESRRLRLQTSPGRIAAVANGYSAHVAVAVVGVPGLVVGRALVRWPRAVVAPVLTDEDGSPFCDAVLGQDLFNSFVVEVDYPARRLRVHDPRDWSAPDDALVLAADWRSYGVVVPVTLELPGGRRIDGRFLVDTGAGDRAAIYSTTRFARRMGLADAGAGIQRRPRGDDPRGAELRLDGVTAELGGLRLPRLSLSFDETGRGVFSDSVTRDDGVIGYDLLRHFNVVFEPKYRRLLLVTPFARRGHPLPADGVFVAAAAAPPR
jgi:hypothetical protein